MSVLNKSTKQLIQYHFNAEKTRESSLKNLVYKCTANKVSLRIQSDLSIPRNKTAWLPYFQHRIKMFCLPIFTFIYYERCMYFQGRSAYFLFCCSQIGGHILGIYKSLTDT